MSIDVYAARRDRVRAKMHEQGLDALLVCHAANRYYLSGFELHDPQCNESAGRLLITAKKGDWLLTDSRYLDAAKRLWDEDRIFIYKAPVFESIGDFLRDKGGQTVGFEDSIMSYEMHAKMSLRVDLQPVTRLVEKVRYIKDEAEIGALRESCELNHRVFKQIEKQLAPGMTEADLAWQIEKLYREQGASELAFATIAAVGPNGALPHAIPGSDKIFDNCPVLIDKGCRVNEYCSDQTRTFWVGDTPTDEFKRALDLTQQAQAEAISAIRPGLPIAEAYHVARGVFERHGVEKHFTHSLGHGIGLETHEPPSVSPKAVGVFKPGMVVTVEPGLYYPQWGGIRWEYMILVTEDGCEVM